MEKIIEFYNNLSKKNKVLLPAALLLIILSSGRIVMSTRSSGPPRIGDHLKNIHSENKDARVHSIYIVGKTGQKSAIPELKKILQEDRDDDIRRVTARSIGMIDKKILLKFLEEDRQDIKNVVVEALLYIDGDNIHDIFKLFHKQPPETRMQILSHSEHLKEKEHIQAIMNIAEDTEEDIGVRKRALDIISGNPGQELEQRLWTLYYNDPREDIKIISRSIIDRWRQRR